MSIESMKTLKQRYGNSNASTFWRMVEEYRGPGPMVGIVSEQPHRLPSDFDRLAPCRYVIQSRVFRMQFSAIAETQLFAAISGYCSYKSGGHLGTSQVVLADDNGERHEFVFESFCFRFTKPDHGQGFQVLTLGVHARKLTQVNKQFNVEAAAGSR